MDDKKETARKKTKSQAKSGGKNILVEKIAVFYTNIASEFKKIIWPKKEELAKQTLIVITVCLIIGTIIFGMDSVLAAVLKMVAGVI